MLDIILKSIAVLVVDSQYFICDYLKWWVIVDCLTYTHNSHQDTAIFCLTQKAASCKELFEWQL